jgi:hypothetical protein
MLLFLGIVKNKSDVYKTLIICNNTEIADVEEWLLQKGINSMALTDSSNKEEIEACETEWASTRGGQYKGIDKKLVFCVFIFNYFSFIVYGFCF